jgi:hypothetical protein
MNFDENEIISAAMLGFDMIEGPVLKWTRTFVANEINIDFENFLMNFYLSFRGGNDGLKPRAILYDKFYIVAFPRGLELVCLFMKPRGIEQKLDRLGNIAEALVMQMEAQEDSQDETPSNQNFDEVKRIIINMLHGQQLSTPEIRRYFKMSNSEVWKIMSELEESEKIARTAKMGRAQLWTTTQ